MTKLFISTDLNTGSSGDIVASKELEFMQSLDDSNTYLGESTQNVIILDYNMIHPIPNKLDDFPFFIDVLTLHKLSKIDLTKITLAHMYGGCYPQTIKYLKSKGVKTSYSCMMHDRQISINEHEKIYGQNSFPFAHIKDDKLYQMYVIDSIQNADLIITPGNAPKLSLLKEGAKKVICIPHGCIIPNENIIKPFPNEFRIGYLGACGPDKGLVYLIKAEDIIDRDSILIFAGNQSQYLEPFIKQNAKTGKYHLMGYVKNVADFYNQISIYVQPSATEAWGMETVEAMSFGRPVIVSCGAGSADAVTNGEDGFVVPKMNPQSIAEKIQYFKDNPKEIERMGKNARNKSLNYDWKQIRQKYTDLWKSMI